MQDESKHVGVLQKQGYCFYNNTVVLNVLVVVIRLILLEEIMAFVVIIMRNACAELFKY